MAGICGAIFGASAIKVASTFTARAFASDPSIDVDLAQNFETADPANRFIRVRKMMADIAFTDRAEQRIGNCMAKNVSVGMSIQSAIMRNLDSAEN